MSNQTSMMPNSALDALLADSGVTTRNESTAELLDRFGLNWTVSKQALCLPDGSPTQFYGVIRDDNRSCFATVKEGYTPYQNTELAALVTEAAGQLGLSIDKGGMFKGGALLYLQVSTGAVRGLGENNDTVSKYVTAINSHDGSSSLRWGISNITISCQNSFWSAYKALLQNRARHTKDIHVKVEEIIRDIQAVQSIEADLYEKFFKLAEVPVKRENIISVVNRVTGVDLSAQDKSKFTPYQMNRVNELSRAINNEMGQKGQTLWGLFSGLTKYTTHVMPGGSVNRAQSKAIGQGYDLDNAVFAELVEVVR